ncbi:restriction endonuclease subunit S [Stutzerimonas frequens]|uniref:restriction endonuclease subunit S n=1 Tax=Stutzerimonas frequens TaxID=2968969 RepID=UPI00255402A6|nr:restriction endonuclease subunit S [Stutzerimonas frequens]MDL0439375.1 restriction endonuclease subunit S [Stutzerimonas frequens]
MSFSAYPVYKESGVEWLGEVPEHWEVTKLSYVTSRIGSGKTPSGGAAAYASSGVPFIRSQNVHDQGLRLDDIVYIDEETDTEMAWSRVRPLDVLINITGASIGRSCQVPAKFGRANVNQHVCVIRLDKAVETSDWVAWFMKSPSSKEQVKVSQTGAAREGLNFEQLAGFYLCMPPLHERKLITAFLDHETARIDALIEEQQRLIELLKEKRQAVISHAVTKGLDSTVPMKDSSVEWLGEVPAHWGLSKLKFLCTIQTGDKDTVNAKEDGEYDFFVRSQTVERIDSFTFDCEAVLTAGDGVGVGKVFHYANGKFDFHQRVYMLNKFRLVCGEFVFHYLKENFYKVALAGEAKSTVDSLRMATFLNFMFTVPSEAEQIQIIKFVKAESEKFDSLVSEAEVGVCLLKERRSALISAAVTGKIDVRDWQPTASTQAPELAVAEAV